MLVDFDVRGQQGMEFFTGESVIILWTYLGILDRSDSFQFKMP